jgi:hypothetical protein
MEHGKRKHEVTARARRREVSSSSQEAKLVAGIARDLRSGGFLKPLDQEQWRRMTAVIRARLERIPREAEGASKPAEVETRLLKGQGLPGKSQGDLPLAKNWQVGKLLGHRHMLSSDSLAEMLGVTRQTIHDWHEAGKVLGVGGARRGLLFPDWQIGPRGKPYDLIPRLLAASRGDHWAVWRFLEGPIAELNKIGHEAMAEGLDKRVLEVAEARGLGAFS